MSGILPAIEAFTQVFCWHDSRLAGIILAIQTKFCFNFCCNHGLSSTVTRRTSWCC